MAIATRPRPIADADFATREHCEMLPCLFCPTIWRSRVGYRYHLRDAHGIILPLLPRQRGKRVTQGLKRD